MTSLMVPEHLQRLYLLIPLLFLSLRQAYAQTVINGQIFTNGLAIVDAPAMNSQQHAENNLSLAIDISGDGKLASSSYTLGSSDPNRYDFLEVYLVSSATNLNLTVSSNSSLLSQDPPATVAHLDWPIPACAPTGTYNLTIYEASHLNNDPFFSITYIPIQIQNSDVSGSCQGNALLAQPQSSSPPPQSVLADLLGTTAPGNPTVITIVISGSGALPFDFPTVTVTDTSATETITVVYESPSTLTTVMPGPTDSVTETLTTTDYATSTMVSHGGTFVPVNSATVPTESTLFSFFFTAIGTCIALF